MERLTEEQIQAKADELTLLHKSPVHPIVFEDGEDQIVGYVQEPNRFTKIRALDKAMQSPSLAATELLEACLVREESNPRMYSEKPEDDKIYLGAAMSCFELIKISVNQFKKK